MIFFKNISKFILRNRKFSCNNLLFNGLFTSSEETWTSDEYTELVKGCFNLKEVHNCLIVQPYVKWGNKKLSISPQEQLDEAVALIKTLPLWTVEDTITIPLESLEKKKLFGSGNMDKLSQMVRKNSSITAVFINQSNLKRVTTEILNENFHKKIFDRYMIIIQILKIHAISKHAQLQVALAELHFIRRKALQKEIFFSQDYETLKLIFQRREQILKSAILDVRHQRELLRKKRKKLDYPVIAVVGYTNSGKTSLIKALTGEEKLQPRNQLFATLDVTVHEGMLPSGLKVLYVDTVGFISDIPTNLLECFVATLEDALLADVILHVEDLSSSCFEYKNSHVLHTLHQLANEPTPNITGKIMSIGNKSDLHNQLFPTYNNLKVSAKNGTGLDVLRFELEKKILQLTCRQKITIRVLNGGDEMSWLHKNSTVINEVPDDKCPQLMYWSM